MINYLLKKFGLFCALFLDCCGSKSHGNNYLWEIEGNPPSYLFGPFHVPYPLLWNAIPENMMQAFNNTQSLYLEIDNNEEIKSAMKSCQQLPNNQTVYDILPHDVYLRLLSHMKYVHAKFEELLTSSQKNKGWTGDHLFKMYFDGWETREPIWTSMHLASITKTIIRSIEYPVLDSYLEVLGRYYAKFVGGIETVNDRCAVFKNIKQSYVLHILDKIFELIENRKLESWVDNFLQQYRDGTLSRSMSIPGMTMEVNHYIEQQFQFRRNLIMSQRIIDLIQSDPNNSFFFAFGNGHFIGDNSVIDMLRQKGVNITRVPRDRVIPQSKTQEFFRYSLPPR